VLKLLGGLNGYKRFVLDGLKQEHNEEYYAVQEQRFLGTEEFGQKVKEKAHEDSRTQGKALAAVVEELARRLKLGVDSLQGPNRSWKVSRLRGLVVYVLTRRLGYPVKEVAQCFGRDATSISVLANRVSARIEQHPAIRGECENLVKFV
jgi:chromosomal replication initiation ATPase DnaA